MKKKKINKYVGFTTSAAFEKTDVSPRRLKLWDEKGIVKPSLTPNRQKGQVRRYSIRDLICILVIKQLREEGVTINQIKKCLESAERLGIDHPLSRLRIACIAKTIIFKVEGRHYDPISGQMYIENAIDYIRPKIKKNKLTPVETAVKRVDKKFIKRMTG